MVGSLSCVAGQRVAVGLAALLSLLAPGPAAAGTLSLRAESTAEIGLDGETLVSHLINRGFAVERPYDHATGRFVPLLLRQQVDVVRRSDAEAASVAAIEVAAWNLGADSNAPPLWTLAGNGEAAQSWGEQFLVITKLGCCGARDVYTGYSLLNGKRLFSATGNRLPGDWARLEVPNSGGLLRWAFLHAAYSADADSTFAGFPGAVAMVSYVSETEPERRLLFSAADARGVDRFMGWDSMVGFIVDGHDQAEQQVELWSSDGRRDLAAIGGISLSVRFTENLVATIPIVDDTLDLARATLPKGLTVQELPVR
jgi:hypothetical protein